MANVARAKTSPDSQATDCPCGWGRHCRCLAGQRRRWTSALLDDVRAFLMSGADLGKRREAVAALRDAVEAHDQHERDTVALRTLIRMLPRQKDVDLVRRITCDDYRAPQTDEEIALSTRTPLAHVRELRARVVAGYEGRPLPVPSEWRRLAAERRARARAERAPRKAATRARRVA